MGNGSITGPACSSQGFCAEDEDNRGAEDWEADAGNLPPPPLRAIAMKQRTTNGSSSSFKPINPLQLRLLEAVKQDNAPQVLQHIADGADFVDIGEALRLAVQRGSYSVARELVAVGMSVNEACPLNGLTPLHLAVCNGHGLVCELLLDALADVHTSVGGTTALSIAKQVGNEEAQEAIERHIAILLHNENDDQAANRRAHVLPRVSPVLSEELHRRAPMMTPRGALPATADAMGLPDAENRSGVFSNGDTGKRVEFLPAATSKPDDPNAATHDITL